MDREIDYVFYKLFHDTKDALDLINYNANPTIPNQDNSSRNETISGTTAAQDPDLTHSVLNVQESVNKQRLRQLVPEITQRLVLLSHMLPNTFLNALDIIKMQFSATEGWRKHKLDAMTQGAGSELDKISKFQDKHALVSLGHFTLYQGSWEQVLNGGASVGLAGRDEQKFEFWKVDTENKWSPWKHKRRDSDEFGDVLLGNGVCQDGDSFQALVDLSTWHCNCAEYVLSKYQSRRIVGFEELSDISVEDNNGKDGNLSGWGRGYLGNINKLSGQVPYCSHLMAVFLYVNGDSLFQWERHINKDPAMVIAYKEDDSIAGVYEKTSVSNLSELVNLFYNMEPAKDQS